MTLHARRQPRTCPPLLAALVAFVVALAAPRAGAQDRRALEQIRGVDIEEHIGRTLPLDLELTTSEGKKVRLGDYFAAGNSKPVILGLVYYRCPMVCDVFMAKTAMMMHDMDYTPGEQYRTLYVSFDPRETAAVAAEAKERYYKEYAREVTPGVREGWQYHVTDAAGAKTLADALGFRYRQMPDGNFSHPVAKYIITPDGKVSRYLYGYSQDPRDLKLALIEATQGKLVATVGERVMAFCYVFDPTLGKYTLRAVRVMQVGGLLTLTGLAVLIGLLFAGERARRRQRLQSADQTQPPNSSGPTTPSSPTPHATPTGAGA